MIKSDSIDKILPSLIKVKAELKALTKSADNPFFKSKYVDLNTTLESVEPLLADNGIIVLQPVNGSSVETMLLHESGQFISSSMDMVLSKQDMQAAGSAVTYARRYTLQSLLSMKAEDDDAEGSVGRSKPAFSKKEVVKESKEQKTSAPVEPKKQSSFKPKVSEKTKEPVAAGGWS